MITSGLRISGFSNPAIFELAEEGVRPCPGTSLPPGQTAFQHFFAPLWQYLNGEFLLAGHGQSAFTSGMVLETSSAEIFDAEYARWVVDLDVDQQDLTLFRPGVVSAWGHSVIDDWCSIIGLGTHADHALRIATKLIQLDPSEGRFRETVLQEARSVLRCHDGRAWDLYVEDPLLLDAVASHALSTGPFLVTRLSVDECLTFKR